MKKLNLLLLLLFSAISLNISAHDFEAVNSDGKTIYYNITPTTKLQVSVTYRGGSYSSYSDEYAGEITIPSTVSYDGKTYSVTKIGSGAFSGCSGLTSVTIPNSVTSIGHEVFEGCSGLTSIIVDEANSKYDSREECNAIIESETNTLILGCKSTIIPNSVSSIGDYAFYGCRSLTSVTIPNSISSIGDKAFYYCSGLTSVTIPNSVSSIGDYAFQYCSGLTSVTIGNSVTSIGEYAFYGCSGLASVTIGNSVTSIGEYAFSGCSGLTSVTIGNSVTSIGNSAFYGCSGLKELTIEDGEEILSFGSIVFTNAPIESVYLGRSLSDASFKNKTTLTSLTIGNSVTSIGNEAFKGCSGLTSIIVDEANSKYDSREECNAIIESETNTLILGCKSTIIPNSVTKIGSGAFSGCSGLTSVTIPNSVTKIGNSAFSDCSGLTSVTIPNSVTSIGYDAFEGCSGLTSVTIPNSVTKIGSGAFEGCSGLTSVTIPNSVTSIEYDAFEGCSGLTSVTIPNSVTSIGSGAFSGCSGLTSVTIPNSITSIDNYAFEGCSELRELIIENGEKTLSLGNNGSGKDLFYDCPLESLYLGRNISYDYDPFKNKTTLKTLTIGNSITSIGNSAFYGCSELRELIIEDGEKTLSLGNNGSGKGLFYDFPLESLYLGRNISSSTTPFYNKTILKTLTIGNSFTSIDNYAFEGFSKLESVTIGNSVTKIGNYAFSGCSGLKELTIEDGEGVLSLGFNGSEKGLFYDCPLESLYLGRDLSYDTSKYYGYSPFYNKSTLTSLTIGNSVTKIGNYAFEGCTGLKELIIENGEKTLSLASYSHVDVYGTIGPIIDLFDDCPLESLYLGRHLSYVGNPFKNKTILKTLTIGNSVTSIDNYVFEGCSGLKELTIEDGEEILSFKSGVFTNAPIESVYLGRSLSDASFKNKTTLKTLTIGNSVTSIVDKAFDGCSGLKELTIEDSEKTLSLGINGSGKGLFYDCPLETLYLGRNLLYDISYDEYTQPFYNKTILKTLTIGNSVTSIGNSAFSGCSGLTSVTIPNSVTSIGYSAFYGCSGLKELTIEDGEEVLSFGSNVFSNAPIENVYLGRSLSDVSSASLSLFYKKTTLTSLTIGNGVTSIGKYAFSGCSGLTSVTIPNSVTSIEYSAFDGCSGLTSVTIPNSVTSIEYSAFYGCCGLTSVTIPNSVTSIGNYAFDGCSGLTSITIPNSVTSIGKYAFSGCSGLTSVTIGNSVTSIGYDAFNGCTGLKELIIENGEEILSFGSDVFTNAPIESVYLGRHISSNTTPFKNKTTLTSLTIGNSVTSIGNEAFKGCSGLTSIIVDEANSKYDSREECNAIIESETNTLILGCKSTIIPNSVTKIGNSAFKGCSGLKELTIEDGEEILSFGSDVFTDAPIESVYLGRSLSDASSASSSPFYNKTTLKTLTIGNSVTSIGESAFEGCSGLKELTIEDSEKTLSLGTNGSGVGLFNDCPLESLYLGRYISSSMTPFKNKTTLKTLTIGNSVTKIGNSIFYGCSGLTSVTIPSSVTTIVNKAFYGCSGLKELTIEDGEEILSFGSDVFTNAPIESVYLGRSLSDASSASSSLFYNKTTLKTLTIGNGVTKIGNQAFNGCSSLTSVTIPNSVTTIGEAVFDACSGLTSVTIPNSVTSIGRWTFRYCSGLTSVTIPNSVTSIGKSAFKCCSALTSITIPNSVTTIGDYTFESCTGLKSVTLGNSVTSIGTSAFHGCSGLTKIYSLSSDPAVCGKSPFYAVDKTIPVYIPFGSKSAYKSAAEWKDFTNFIESEFTGVEEEEISTSDIKVISGNGIEVSDYYGRIRIVNLAGQVIKDVYVSGYIQLSLPKGIYIVVTENNSQKVVL